MRDRGKIGRLRSILEGIGSCVVAFSGGVDSTFLTAVAVQILGKKAVAATIISPFVPAEERKAARRLAARIGIRHVCLRQALSARIADNPVNRCYYCKYQTFRALGMLARRKGFAAVLDGSNSDDLADFRPGSRAARECGVRSPLQEAGFSKADIRRFSRRMGLETWDKPALACLGSRFPYGERFTPGKLAMVEKAEARVRAAGVRQVRVRYHGGLARIEVEPRDFPVVLRHREELGGALRKLGFSHVTVDIDGYRQGSMNGAQRAGGR